MGRDDYTIIFMGRPCTQDEINALWDDIKLQIIDSDEFNVDGLTFWGRHEGAPQTQFLLDGKLSVILHAYGTSVGCIDMDTKSDEYMWFVMQELLYCGEETACIEPSDIPKPHDERFKLWFLPDFSV